MTTRRNMLGLVGVSILAGCASSNTSPVTQPTQTVDESAYATAAQIVSGITVAATIAEQFVNSTTQADIKQGLSALNSAMAAWKSALNTSTAAELEAAVWALLPTITALISKGKFAKASAMRVK